MIVSPVGIVDSFVVRSAWFVNHEAKGMGGTIELCSVNENGMESTDSIERTTITHYEPRTGFFLKIPPATGETNQRGLSKRE